MKGKVQGNGTEMNGKLKGNGTEMEGLNTCTFWDCLSKSGGLFVFNVFNVFNFF